MARRRKVRFTGKFYILLAFVLIAATVSMALLLSDSSGGTLETGAMRMELSVKGVVIRDEMSISVDRYERVRSADMPVTFSGGDPMLQAASLLPLARRIKEEAHKNIWCYTGYRFESLLERPVTRELLAYVDVLVDGPFILAERDLSLHFRGSRNQRLIDVPRSLKEAHTIEYLLQMHIR